MKPSQRYLEKPNTPYQLLAGWLRMPPCLATCLGALLSLLDEASHIPTQHLHKEDSSW